MLSGFWRLGEMGDRFSTNFRNEKMVLFLSLPCGTGFAVLCAVQERVKLDENIDDNSADGCLDAIVPFRALLGLAARE